MTERHYDHWWKSWTAEVKQELANCGVDWEAEMNKILVGVSVLPEHDLRCIASSHETVPPIVVEKKLAQ